MPVETRDEGRLSSLAFNATTVDVYHGTANHSDRSRAVLVPGMTAADVEVGDVHGVVVTHDYFGRLPDAVRRRLHCSVVDGSPRSSSAMTSRADDGRLTCDARHRVKGRSGAKPRCPAGPC
jgi:hypothetical protein